MSSFEDESLDVQQTTTHERKVVNLIRLAFAFEYGKKPLRREDISKHIFNYEYRTSTYIDYRSLNRIIMDANVKLSQDFGMELVALPQVSKPTSSTTAAGRKKTVEKAAQDEKLDTVYVLTSVLDEKHRKLLSLHRNPAELGLLSTILTMIHLNGADMTEDQLSQTLLTLGITVGDGRDEDAIFGNVHELLDQFKRQKYLLYYRKNDEDKTGMYGIGARAKVELPLPRLREFVSSMAVLTEQPGLESSIKKAF